MAVGGGRDEGYDDGLLRDRPADPLRGTWVDDQMQFALARVDALTRELEHALVRWQGLGQGAFAQFRDCAARYLDFNWRHLNTEEDELLPLARRDLRAEDWAEIDRAFAANFDPFAGPNREYAALFDRIVELAPAPIGHGGSARA